MTCSAEIDSFYRLTTLKKVGSTNDTAKKLAEAGAPEGTLIWAHEQTDGRGRQGRDWSSPPGNLYASLILRPSIAANRASQFSFIAAVAMADMLASLLPAPTQVHHKWPNDVLVAGRKIAGILLESSACGDGALEWLVVGMGVNVDSHPDSGDYEPTSLRAQGVELTPGAVLTALCDSMLAWRERWLGDGFSPVRAAWHDRAVGINGLLLVEVSGRIMEGNYLGIDENGALVLDVPGSGRRLITVGEVGNMHGLLGR